MPNSDEHVDQALRKWTVTVPLPPRFQEGVWQRIGRADSRSFASAWPGFARLVEVILPRPKVALSYLALLAFLGVAGGSWTAQLETNRIQAHLSARYVRAIDPYVSVGDH